MLPYFSSTIISKLLKISYFTLRNQVQKKKIEFKIWNLLGDISSTVSKKGYGNSRNAQRMT
jgi:hypothetical protein